MVGLLTALVLSTVAPAWACSTCACGDPTLTTMGAEKPFAGRVRLGTEVRFRTERAETEAGVWRAQRLTLDLSATWVPHDRVVLGLNLPVGTAAQVGPSLASERGWGLGDAELRGRFVVVRDRAGHHQGGLLTSVQMPTGPRLQRDNTWAGDDAQPGNGAWTPSVGLWHAWYGGLTSVFTSAVGRVSSPGWDDRRPGAVGLFGVTTQIQPVPAFAVRVGLDLRAAFADRLADATDPTTGGWRLQLTPGFAASPTTDVLLFAGIGVPLAQRLGGGSTREGVVPSVGVVVDL